MKVAVPEMFSKRGVPEAAAITRPAVASNVHNLKKVVGVHYGNEDQGEGSLLIII